MSSRRERQRIWFERWIREGYSVRHLHQQSGYSCSTLQRIISYWLERPPRTELDLTRYKYLVMDGSYLKGRHTAVVCIADPTQNCLVAGWYGVKEGSSKLVQLCRGLAGQGLSPFSVTIDGLPQMHDLVRMLWPQALVQRCLVHVQRQGLAWCRLHPRRTDARHLRPLFLRTCAIHNADERDSFLQAWSQWEDRFGTLIESQTERGRIFSDLKRARSMLSKALPYMFAYLEDPNIPISTNWIESYFSRLKSRYRQHRGLNPQQRANYFQWYFHLCRK